MPYRLSDIGLVRDDDSQQSSFISFIAQYSRMSWDDIVAALEDSYINKISTFEQVAQKFQYNALALYHLLYGVKKTSSLDDCRMQADLLAQVLSVSITVFQDDQILGQWGSASKREQTKYFFFIGLGQDFLLYRFRLDKNVRLTDVQDAIAQRVFAKQPPGNEEKKLAKIECDLKAMRLEEEQWQVVPPRGSSHSSTSTFQHKRAFFGGRGADDCCERVIPVHYDDIHAITVSRNHLVVTGSKDTTLKATNPKSGATKIIGQGGEKEAPTRNYKQWVTAATDTTQISNSEQFFVGYRNGDIRRVNLDNNTFPASFSVSPRVYESFFSRPFVELKKNAKLRNHQRITALSLMEDDRLLVGMSQLLFMIDFNLKQIITSVVFRAPEWVYGFAALGNPGYYAVIHGAQLSAFEVVDQAIVRVVALLPEEQPNGRQRKFISAINTMPENKDHVAMSLFGGVNKVVDVSSGTVLHYAKEHASVRSKDQRVWQALPWSGGSYLTCADDHTIKLWDIRAQRASLLTITGHGGRVSTLKRVDTSMFVAGTCPDRPDEALSARLFFYDMRKLSAPLKRSPALQPPAVPRLSM